MARNREATARLCWSPYMHNPKLKARLHRIPNSNAVPVGQRRPHPQRKLWGVLIVQPLRALRFETIDRAGHFPQSRQPDEFARRVLAFADAEAQKARPARRASGD